MSGIPLPEHRLPGLAPLLSGALWRRWAATGRVFPLDDFRGAVGYVRLKPQTSCRVVVFDPASDAEIPDGFLLQLFGDTGRAADLFDKVRAHRQTIGARGFEPFLCEDSATVGLPFPNDLDLPGLRHLFRPYRRKELLTELLGDRLGSDERVSKRASRLRLLTYKPGRRAVFQALAEFVSCDGARPAALHLKVEHRATFEASYRKLREIERAVSDAFEWSVPTALGSVPSQCVTARRWAAGTPLSAPDESDPEFESFAAAGRALAEFHALSYGSRSFPFVRAAGDLTDIAADVIGLLPDLTARVQRLASRLSSSLSALDTSASLLHGDFHADQVLVCEGRLLLHDFDRAGCGHPALDVGAFLASVDELELPGRAATRFLDSYVERRGRSLEPDALASAQALAVLRRASVPLRSLDPQWPEKIRCRIALAETLMGVHA